MGIRTPDLLHAMEARYQLRHSPFRSMSLAASGRSPIPLFEDRLPGDSLSVSCGRMDGRMTLGDALRELGGQRESGLHGQQALYQRS